MSHTPFRLSAILAIFVFAVASYSQVAVSLNVNEVRLGDELVVIIKSTDNNPVTGIKFDGFTDRLEQKNCSPLALQVVCIFIPKEATRDEFDFTVTASGLTITEKVKILPRQSDRKKEIEFALSNQNVLAGQAVVVSATVHNGIGEELPSSWVPEDAIVWEVPDELHGKYVRVEGKPDGKAVVYGLSDDPTNPNAAKTRPSNIAIKATYTDPNNTSNPESFANFFTVNILPAVPREVDVQWMVLPKSSCGDNFGKRIKDKYYCVVLVIGNQSGFDLQITSVGFTIPKFDIAKKVPIPNTPYQVVRGSLDKEQKVGDRNLAVNLLTGLGSLATGFVPFFKNTGSQNTFSNIVNIFSNPFTEGFKLAAPDLTVDQAFKLDDFSFRNDLATKTIIASNTQIVTMVFFPKTFLYPDTDVEANKKSKKQVNDSREVMKDLGEVVLIGRKVEYSNRIRLNSDPITAAPATTPSPQ